MYFISISECVVYYGHFAKQLGIMKASNLVLPCMLGKVHTVPPSVVESKGDF